MKPIKSTRKHPEAELQRAVAKYLDLALPKHCWWTAIGHGGGGKIRGAQLKAMGVKPGVADIMVLRPCVVNLGPVYETALRIIWIELKSANGRQSADQERFESLMCAMPDTYYCVARSVVDVAAALETAGVELRARP